MTTDTTHRYVLALEIGEEAIRQGKWQQALTCFQTALTGLPREPRVYNGLGDTHLALADRGRALACYKEAARLAGDNAEYVGKVADIQESLGLVADAARSRLIAGDILWSHGQFDRAEGEWLRVLALQRDSTAARERLAVACRRRGDLTATARHYLALADILRREGRCLMALHICYTLLSELPGNQIVWSATDEAWRCVAVRDRQQPPADGRVEPGDLLNAAADFAQWQLAAAIRQSTLRSNHGDNPEAHIHLRQAILNEGYGRAGMALAAYEKAIAAGLNMPAIFFALGMLYRLVGRRADSRAALLLASRHPLYQRAVALLD
jgi:tetratricopeptide (TPR) repeat protein